MHLDPGSNIVSEEVITDPIIITGKQEITKTIRMIARVVAAFLSFLILLTSS